MSEHELLRIEQLLKGAILHQEGGDDKLYCQPDDIALLLEHGADPRGLNLKQVDRGYVHRVLYQGYVFTAVTDEKVHLFTWHTAKQN